MIAHLTGRAVIALSGPDTRTLLQGLITNDVDHLAPGRGLYAGLLTPQGKVLFDFLLSEADGTIFLDCPAAAVTSLAKRLTLYRLRAKVSIEPRADLAVLAAWDGSALPGIPDPRLAALGVRSIVPATLVPAGAAGADAYLAHRLALGVPEGTDFGSEAMFALDADFEELHGVDFKKGCYVGQELTSRMKHRATARKRLLPFAAAAALAPGAAVMAADKSIGEIASVYGARGFALIRLDKLGEAGGAPLTADGAGLTLATPSWLHGGDHE